MSDRFTWYSDKPKREYPRHVSDLQKTIQQLHPGPAGMFAQKVIDSFKAGKQDHFEQPLKLNGQMVYINYYALRDQDGNYLGTIGYTGTVNHIADLIKHGAWDQDVTTGASMHQSMKSPTKPSQISPEWGGQKLIIRIRQDQISRPALLILG
ncbi:PAS domain-containing protein [Lentilactobacillus parafarraginis]|uniref:PAS domain-containing protein n=1 Tax=Lentilactobacillus parafarraginis TaxID=390842 RepID=UPI0006CFB328|nr:PAS domain-containing protein [Lentilactobacillus parafarraginis]